MRGLLLSPTDRGVSRARPVYGRRRHPQFATMTAIGALLLLQQPVSAAPQGGNVVAGSATISQSGATTNVNQSTNKAIINWQSFSVGASETVNFNQPSSTSVTLNRVIGNESSVIAGAINANGQVFIVNSAGILFTGTSQVNVGGLIASTLDISNSDFMAGNYTFSGSSTASVVNKGAINAASGGYVVLMGNTVSNQGIITATLGTVALSSGSKLTLNFSGDSLVDVTIDEGVLNALVENKQLIKADGGKVIMTAKAADAVLSAQVNNSGIIQARTMASLTGGTTATKKGSITLKATGGTTKVSGTLDASAPSGGDGGFIETSGNTVKIDEAATITTVASLGATGTWLIDPDGFTIAATGGDITGTVLGAQLEKNNVVIESTSGSGSDGDVTVNDTVSWLANTTLTLNATNDININAPIYASGESAGVVLNFGGYASTGTVASGTDYYIGSGGSISLPGASATLAIIGQSYTLIHSMAELAAISSAVIDPATGQQAIDPDSEEPVYKAADGYYALAQNLDASGTTYTGPVVATLTGTLAGLGHTINDLTIVNTSSGGLALIGTVGAGQFSTATNSDATVRDLGLVNPTINAGKNGDVATLAVTNWGIIENSYAINVSVVGGGTEGGLVAWNRVSGVIKASYVGLDTSNDPAATSTVSTSDALTYAVDAVGGFVGVNYGTITSSYSQASVTALGSAGGFFGTNYPTGSISDSYATGDVTSNGGGAGGFGISNYGSITGSYSTGTVKSTYSSITGNAGSAGGFVNSNYFTGGKSGTISDSWSSSAVTVDNSGSPNDTSSVNAGGFAAVNYGTLDGVRAYGNVINTTGVAGGLVGSNSKYSVGPGIINNSIATGNVSGYYVAGGLVGAMTGGSVSGSSAYGNVTNSATDGAYLGGLAGYITGGTINTSVAYGTVSSPATGPYVYADGVVGGNWGGGITNSSHSSDANAINAAKARENADLATASANATTAAAASSAAVQSSATQQGAHQTAVDRADAAAVAAAAAAFAQSRLESAQSAAMSAATTGVQETADRPPSASDAAAGTSATAALAGPSVASQIDSSAAPAPTTSWRQLQEQDERRRKRAAQQARPAAAPTGGYGGAIRSIDVDGQHFDLEKDTAPAGAAPATPAQPAAPAQ